MLFGPLRVAEPDARGSTTLMCHRELAVLGKISSAAKLNIVLGENRPGRPRGQPV